MLLKINIDFAIKMSPFNIEYYNGKIPVSVYSDKIIFKDFDEMKQWFYNDKKLIFVNANDLFLKVGFIECNYSNYFRCLYRGNTFITTERYFLEV
jgi:hypothetical protein